MVWSSPGGTDGARYSAEVTGIRSAPADLGLAGQLTRFVLIGGVSALVDLGVYLATFALGVNVHVAKGIGFVCGTTTAYLLNRRFTFATAGGKARLAGFMLLYGTTLTLNVSVNGLMLTILPRELPLQFLIAWAIAQGTATSINFIMLRKVVFRPRASRGEVTGDESVPRGPAAEAGTTPRRP